MDHGRDCTERDVSEGQISPKLLHGWESPGGYKLWLSSNI